MNYQIDQSIKIEDTSKTSYVCLANDVMVVASISAKEKRELKLFFRELERPLIFKLFTFSVLCAKVIMKARPHAVEIDKEYLGHEAIIKSFIIQICSIWGYSKIRIDFREVGKASPAHLGGYKAYKDKGKGEVVSAKEVLVLYNLVNKA